MPACSNSPADLSLHAQLMASGAPRRRLVWLGAPHVHDSSQAPPPIQRPRQWIKSSVPSAQPSCRVASLQPLPVLDATRFLFAHRVAVLVSAHERTSNRSASQCRMGQRANVPDSAGCSWALNRQQPSTHTLANAGPAAPHQRAACRKSVRTHPMGCTWHAASWIAQLPRHLVPLCHVLGTLARGGGQA